MTFKNHLRSGQCIIEYVLIFIAIAAAAVVFFAKFNSDDPNVNPLQGAVTRTIAYLGNIR